MAFCWWADDGPTLNAGLAAFVIFQGIQTSIAEKPYIFVNFHRGSGPPVPPPSGSAPVHYKTRTTVKPKVFMS